MCDQNRTWRESATCVYHLWWCSSHQTPDRGRKTGFRNPISILIYRVYLSLTCPEFEGRCCTRGGSLRSQGDAVIIETSTGTPSPPLPTTSTPSNPHSEGHPMTTADSAAELEKTGFKYSIRFRFICAALFTIHIIPKQLYRKRIKYFQERWNSYLCTHTPHARTHAHTRTCTHTRTHTHAHTHTHRTHTHTHTRNTHTHAHTRKHTQRTHTHARTHTNTHACTHTHTHTPTQHTHTDTHTHAHARTHARTHTHTSRQLNNRNPT